MIRRLLILLAASLIPALAAPEKQAVNGVSYQLLRAPAANVRLVWKDASGKQLHTFPRASAFLNGRGEIPDTIMNGGIFEPGGIPSGLLVQDGRELRPLNRRDGNGNFFLKPNGVFLVGEKEPR